ncbi:hypothetical protein CVT24_011742 [Panaeolus cyanescens]|uniref:G domain-containing protein n=1 Tax=Panaeolus cyanescens TaxID=181874 RepID=A0A409YP79_9AGAR|nr:hypothetical protein CVT24_011742 [Panaeolus cyanescens]
MSNSLSVSPSPGERSTCLYNQIHLLILIFLLVTSAKSPWLTFPWTRKSSKVKHLNYSQRRAATPTQTNEPYVLEHEYGKAPAEHVKKNLLDASTTRIIHAQPSISNLQGATVTVDRDLVFAAKPVIKSTHALDYSPPQPTQIIIRAPNTSESSSVISKAPAVPSSSESAPLVQIRRPTDLPHAQLDVEALHDVVNKEDKIIVFLGRTGAGKSNFIEKLATKKLGISSAGSERGTSEVQAYRVLDPTYKNQLILVDSPGFQDVSMSEYGSLKAIREWMVSHEATRLHALFYFDRINENMKGQDPQCHQIFSYLCGEACKRAYLVTTTWDMLLSDRLKLEGEKKFKKLSKIFEKNRVVKFSNTAKSAKEILDESLKDTGYDDSVQFYLENLNIPLQGPPLGEIIFELLKNKYWSAIKTPALPAEIASLRVELLEFDAGGEYMDKLDKEQELESIEYVEADEVSTAPQRSDSVTCQPVIFIVVMGQTGTGKTTLIHSLIDYYSRGNVLVQSAPNALDSIENHGLYTTKEVKLFTVQLYGTSTGARLVLVDTPGFNNPSRSDAVILKHIAEYLEKSCRRKHPIDGIIYLHRITDDRFDSGAANSLGIFKRIFGNTGYERVGLVSTMWNDVAPWMKKNYEEKEEELKNTVWKMFLSGPKSKQAFVTRYDAADDYLVRYTSAMQVVSGVIKNILPDEKGRRLGQVVSSKSEGEVQQFALRIQRELVDEGKPLVRTEAGKAAFTLAETAKFYLGQFP